MKDSTDNHSSSLRCICIKEISIRDHLYIISMCLNTCEQTYIYIQIESKETGEQWRSSFDVITIETMTAKTGNYKSFNIFIDMLENAINQKSSSVSIDLLTSNDFELLRKEQGDQRKKRLSSTKRYLILIYNVEYDRICYPLSLRYCDKADANSLTEQIRQLTIENQLLKSRVQSDNEHGDLQQTCFDSNVGNDNYSQLQGKNQQIDFLRQMVRTGEDALIKERIHLQKAKTKKDNRYKIYNDQMESLKTSERRLKSKVKVLTNEIVLLKKNSSPYDSQQTSGSSLRPTSDDLSRYRSASRTTRLPSSSESPIRFNPTAYVDERNRKIRQYEWQKKKETRERLSTGQYLSDSDISDITLKANDNNSHKPKSSRKRTKKLDQHQSTDSIDSDIERVSSPLILHRAASNNSTILISPDQNENSISVDNMTDIDRRLKSLHKFLKQNFIH